MNNFNLNSEWYSVLAVEFEQLYIQQLFSFLQERQEFGAIIYPKSENCFEAFNHTPLSKVRVVILGQDPYHGPGQAHGLSFSVPSGVPLPPSLRNIYQELRSDVGVDRKKNGCLESWAAQGVFLLNSVLTVEEARAGSHQGKGWERFTDRVIAILNEYKDPLVFMLWGSYAQKKGAFIDRERHLVLEAPHPSPLSAHRGFISCKHFSKANTFLQQHGFSPIDWSL